jgi:hypothetical protein
LVIKKEKIDNIIKINTHGQNCFFRLICKFLNINIDRQINDINVTEAFLGSPNKEKNLIPTTEKSL